MLTLLCCFWGFCCPVASSPHLVKHFYYSEGESCSSHLILGSDSLFFYSRNCENEIGLCRGRWSLVGPQLTLTLADSALCFPRATVTYGKFRSDDSVRISFTDCFGLPFTATGLYKYDHHRNSEFQYLDAQGATVLSSEECHAFVPVYFRDELGRGRPDTYQEVRKDSNDIHILLDYPNETSLDRVIAVRYFGGPNVFQLKDSVLMDKEGQVIYKEKKE